jgi:two pore calcium channel protein
MAGYACAQFLALVHMYVLATTTSYPDAFMPAYRRNGGTFVFFLVFILVGLFFIVPMVQAVVMVREGFFF